MNREPALTVGIVSAAVAAVIALGVAFGLPITDGQQQAILVAIAPVFALIVAVSAIIRQHVYSPESVAEELEETYDEGFSDGVSTANEGAFENRL